MKDSDINPQFASRSSFPCLRLSGIFCFLKTCGRNGCQSLRVSFFLLLGLTLVFAYVICLQDRTKFFLQSSLHSARLKIFILLLCGFFLYFRLVIIYFITFIDYQTSFLYSNALFISMFMILHLGYFLFAFYLFMYFFNQANANFRKFHFYEFQFLDTLLTISNFTFIEDQ